MSPTIEDAVRRRTSIDSETTLSNEADLSSPRTPRLDKLDELGSPAIRGCSPDSTSIEYHDARSSLSVSGTEDEPVTQRGGAGVGSLDFSTLSVTVKRYEMLLSAHHSIIRAYRIVNDKLEAELLRTRDLEARTRRLGLELEEKDRQIAVREARVEALEERFLTAKEHGPVKEKRDNHREKADVVESEGTADGRETLVTEAPRRNLSVCIGACISLILWVVTARCLGTLVEVAWASAR